MLQSPASWFMGSSEPLCLSLSLSLKNEAHDASFFSYMGVEKVGAARSQE